MSHHLPARDALRSNRPQLPAFCRTRRPTVMVSVSSLAALQRLVLLVLVFQLCTLLLVIAWSVPPRPLRLATALAFINATASGLDGSAPADTPHPQR
jgi:hypothetical protein